MIGGLQRMLGAVREDLDAVIARDPSVTSRVEALVGSPGVQAIWVHRASHRMWGRGHRVSARALSQVARFVTGVEIHPGAQLGRRFVIDHGMGVVIGETAVVGDDVLMFHGSTLGGTSMEPGKRHPTVGDRVVIGSGAKILGPITVGEDSAVGANAVVVKDVPCATVAVGVPATNRPRVALRSVG